MFDGQLQVLFYAIPSNSLLLFGQPGNAPFLWWFSQARRGLGLLCIKKLHNTKCLMVTFMSCFMHCPQNSLLLFSEIGNAPLFEDFDGPVGSWGCVESKSCIKQKVLRIWFYTKNVVIPKFWSPPFGQPRLPGRGPKIKIPLLVNHPTTTTEFFSSVWGGRMETLQTLLASYNFTSWRIKINHTFKPYRNKN